MNCRLILMLRKSLSKGWTKILVIVRLMAAIIRNESTFE